MFFYFGESSRTGYGRASGQKIWNSKRPIGPHVIYIGRAKDLFRAFLTSAMTLIAPIELLVRGKKETSDKPPPLTRDSFVRAGVFGHLFSFSETRSFCANASRWSENRL